MAFVEYADGEFVRLEEINFLKIKDGQIEFTVKGDNVSIFSVHEDSSRRFMQGIHCNSRDWIVEDAYKKEFGAPFNTFD